MSDVLKIIVGIMGAMLLAGCQTAPINLTLSNAYDNSAASETSSPCYIRLQKVIDKRSNVETLGEAAGVPVLASNVTDWVSEGLTGGLKHHGYRVSKQRGDLDMLVNIKLAYLRPLPLRLHATVSLEVKLQHSQKQMYRKTLRAIGDRTNWANGEGEIMEVLNIALNKVVADLADDIQPACMRSASL